MVDFVDAVIHNKLLHVIADQSGAGNKLHDGVIVIYEVYVKNDHGYHIAVGTIYYV